MTEQFDDREWAKIWMNDGAEGLKLKCDNLKLKIIFFQIYNFLASFKLKMKILIL